MNYSDFYQRVSPQIIEVGDASFGLRIYGKGAPLVFIHGFFVHGYTWRKILPTLAEKFTCYVIDLPGFGDSVYSKKTNFTFTAQAKRLNKLFKILNINNKFSLIAHDTGASIARLVALDQRNTLEKLVLINTEIPHHRPPYIPMYQFLAKLPFANFMFRFLLKFDFLIRSPLLLNQFFFDKAFLRDSKNLDPYVNPLKDRKNMFGLLSYLKGIEWKVVDGFAENHQHITADTLLLWGEEDKTFPVEIAVSMQQQFKPNCKFIRIKNTCIMPHEECPEEVVSTILQFLTFTKK